MFSEPHCMNFLFSSENAIKQLDSLKNKEFKFYPNFEPTEKLKLLTPMVIGTIANGQDPSHDVFEVLVTPNPHGNFLLGAPLKRFIFSTHSRQVSYTHSINVIEDISRFIENLPALKTIKPIVNQYGYFSGEEILFATFNHFNTIRKLLAANSAKFSFKPERYITSLELAALQMPFYTNIDSDDSYTDFLTRSQIQTMRVVNDHTPTGQSGFSAECFTKMVLSSLGALDHITPERRLFVALECAFEIINEIANKAYELKSTSKALSDTEAAVKKFCETAFVIEEPFQKASVTEKPKTAPGQNPDFDGDKLNAPLETKKLRNPVLKPVVKKSSNGRSSVTKKA